MFNRVLPSLGRYVDRKPSTPAVEERRVWVRHPCTAATTVQSASDPQSAPIAARVHNVSRGGVMLVAGRRIDAGELISIELPGREENRGSVLACVLQTEAAGADEWELNCAFAAELSPGDVRLFDVGASDPVEAEQRSLIRYSCRASAVYEVVGGSQAERGGAAVLDVSIGGIGLATAHPIPLGALLNLEVRDAGGRSVATMLASVVTARPAPDGRSVLGCNFMGELSEAQLHRLA
jgi:hypothetical protein